MDRQLVIFVTAAVYSLCMGFAMETHPKGSFIEMSAEWMLTAAVCLFLLALLRFCTLYGTPEATPDEYD